MFKRVMLSVAAAAAVLGAPGAFADSWKGNKHYPPGRAHQYAVAEYDYARVTHVTPIIRRVRVERPVREYWEETRYENPRYRDDSGTVAKTVLGGIIGGVIGHQVGDGSGKRIATAAGAIIGSAVARNAAERNRSRYDEPPRAYTVERSAVRYETTWEERIEGYEVEYRYNGRAYHTRLPYDPGDRIRIRVDVTPAR
jgi:uncharacterized protein YcfJ